MTNCLPGSEPAIHIVFAVDEPSAELPLVVPDQFAGFRAVSFLLAEICGVSSNNRPMLFKTRMYKSRFCSGPTSG